MDATFAALVREKDKAAYNYNRHRNICVECRLFDEAEIHNRHMYPKCDIGARLYKRWLEVSSRFFTPGGTNATGK